MEAERPAEGVCNNPGTSGGGSRTWLVFTDTCLLHRPHSRQGQLHLWTSRIPSLAAPLLVLTEERAKDRLGEGGALKRSTFWLVERHLPNVRTSIRSRPCFFYCFIETHRGSDGKLLSEVPCKIPFSPRLLSLHDNQIFAKRKERIMQQNTIYSLKTLSLPVCLWRKPLHTSALLRLFMGNYFGIIN